MRLLSVIFFLSFALSSLGQKYRLIDSNKEFVKIRKTSQFIPLHEDYEISERNYIATYKVTFDSVINKSILGIFHELREKCQRFGGNSFRVVGSDIYKKGKDKFIEVKFYFLELENFNKNEKLYYSTEVYLMGYLGHHQNIHGYKVRYNDEEFILQELRYKKFEPEEGESVIIKLGRGMRGTEYTFTAKSGVLPRYFYFEMVTGSFYNSLIAEYDHNFGEFLKSILNPE